MLFLNLREASEHHPVRGKVDRKSSFKSHFLCLLFLGVFASRGVAQSSVAETNGLTLRQALQRVLSYNEGLQMRLLDMEISNRTFRAEHGLFEPVVFGTSEYADNHRPNNSQQQTSLFTPVFNERNFNFESGIEFLVPTGARLRTGASLHDLHNNLQNRQLSGVSGGRKYQHEFETFVGGSLVQPILKNFGPGASLARIRLAAVSSDLAFQEYRRQLMLTVARAESSYWDLYLTQEQERISGESVIIAETILTDNQNRLGVGKSAELEVLQAGAGVSERRARLGEAHRKQIEGSTQLAILLSDSAALTNQSLRAADAPELHDEAPDRLELYRQAFDLNPDYLARKYQALADNIRLAYAKNQRLPQLDLKASYGLNGLGLTMENSFHRISRSDFTTWSVGAELRVPLFGGIRERNELSAAQLSQKRGLLYLKESEVQIYNMVESTLQKSVSLRDNVRSYLSVVEFTQKLLQSQLDALQVGKVDSRTVLETEGKVADARIAALDNLVQNRKSLLELELATGTILQSRNLELSKTQLEYRTAKMLRDGRWSNYELRKYVHDAQKRFDDALPAGVKKTTSAEQQKALDALDLKMKELNPDPSTPEQKQAREALHNEIRKLEANDQVPNGEQQKAIEILRQKLKDLEEEKALPQ